MRKSRNLGLVSLVSFLLYLLPYISHANSMIFEAALLQPQVRVAAAIFKTSLQSIEQSVANQRPDISAYLVSELSANSSSRSIQSEFEIGVEASIILYDGGENEFLTASNRYNALHNYYQYLHEINSQILRGQNLSNEYVRNVKLLRESEIQLSLLTFLRETTLTRIARGEAKSSDLAQSDADLAEAKLQHLALNGLLSESIFQLAVFLNRDEIPVNVDVEVHDECLAGSNLLEIARIQNPQVRGQKLRIKEAKFRKMAAESQMRPKVRLALRAGNRISQAESDGLIGNIGITAEFPTDGGAIGSSNVRKAISKLDQEISRLEFMQRENARSINAAHNDLLRNIERIKILESEISILESIVGDLLNSIEVSSASYYQIADVQIEFHEKKIQLTNLIYDQKNNINLLNFLSGSSVANDGQTLVICR